MTRNVTAAAGAARRQAAYRARQRERSAEAEARVAGLEAENAALRARAESAEAENAMLRAELGALEPAVTRCPHPVEAQRAGRCGLCGEELW